MCKKIVLSEDNERIKHLAVQEWISQLYQIPYNVMKMLIEKNPEEFIDVTYPQVGECVSLEETNDCSQECIVTNYVTTEENIVDQEYDIFNEKTGEKLRNVPMEKILRYKHDEDMIAGPWVFTERIDREWVENHVRDISNLGFMVMRSVEFGYVLALKQDVNDRLRKLWVPLYDLRGLKWHLS